MEYVLFVNLQVATARKGVLITTSSFTLDAREYTKGIGNILMIDGEKLAELMIKYGMRVTEVSRFPL